MELYSCPLRVLDLVNDAGIPLFRGTDEAQKRRLGTNDAHDVSLGFVDRPDERAGRLEQMFADVAQVDPTTMTTRFGCWSWACEVMRIPSPSQDPGMDRAQWSSHPASMSTGRPCDRQPRATLPRERTGIGSGAPTAGLQNASQPVARCQLERAHPRDAATPAADQDWNGHCFIRSP
jgi:hypothetical protein